MPRLKILTQKDIFRTTIGESVLRLRKQIQGIERFENCYNRVVADLTFLNWYRSFRGPNYDGRVWDNPNPAIKMRWNTSRDKKKDRKSPIQLSLRAAWCRKRGRVSPLRSLRKSLRFIPILKSQLPAMVMISHLSRKIFHTTHVSPSRPIMQNRRLYFIKTLTLPLCRRCAAKRPPSLSSKQCLPAALLLRRICLNYYGKNVDDNGGLCFPRKDSIVEGIKFLIQNPDKRLEIQKNAWKSCQNSFTFENWKEQWKSILLDVVNGKSSPRHE